MDTLYFVTLKEGTNKDVLVWAPLPDTDEQAPYVTANYDNAVAYRDHMTETFKKEYEVLPAKVRDR